MTQYTPGPYLRENDLVYALFHSGDYRKGEPVMVNRFWAHVGGHRNTPQGEIEAVARLFQAAPDMADYIRRCASNCPEAHDLLKKIEGTHV